MNVKQPSQNNPNINWGQPEEFYVYEPIEDESAKYISCTKKKKIKISPMYTIHKTKNDVVVYKVELLKHKELIISGRDYGSYEPITKEAFNVSSEEIGKFMDFLSETFALEAAPVNTFVSVDSKGAVREILKKYQSDKSLFETLSMTDLDTINGNVTLQNLKNISKEIEENIDDGGEIKFWHPFLKKYNWILSQLFISPYILFKDEFYVGGKRYDRTGEVRVDFCAKNIKTNNCAIIEIKDAKQPLVSSYRFSEYGISNELSGSISQLLRQRDLLYKYYWASALDDGRIAYEANNIKSILIIGRIPNNNEEKTVFENFRNELRSIEIITFDELLDKVNLQIQIIEGALFSNN